MHIPAPCSENWEDMRPEEKGRHCGACSKTVVDFSLMSDREIIAYLSRAGQHVCGRMAADQLDRAMHVPPAAGKRHPGWWKWLLAGLLVSSEARAQRLPVATVTAAPPKKPVDSRPIFQGLMVRPRVLPDSFTDKAEPVKIQELPPVEVTSYMVVGKMRVTTGEVSTVSGRCMKGDSLAGWMKDTLAALGLVPKKEFNVYPNPVRRGSAVVLTWQTASAGTYETGLYNTEGALIQERVLQVNSKDQVDLLDIPASLSVGTYFLRVTPRSKGRTVTRTLVVL